jgi:hypothetical protein
MWAPLFVALSNLGMPARLDRVPAAERVFAALHVDAGAGEPDTFHAQSAALLEGGVVVEFDVAARAKDTVPGQGIGGVDAEEACDGTMIEGVARGCGNFAVRADFARRDGENDAAEGSVAILIGAQAVAEEGAAPFGGWKDSRVQGERGESGDWLAGRGHE